MKLNSLIPTFEEMNNVFLQSRFSLPLIGLSIFTIFLLLGCVPAIEPKLQSDFQELKTGNYALDRDHASLMFKIDHLGFSKFVGRFNQFDATLEFDPNNIQDSQLVATVNMKSLDLVDDGFERVIKGKKWLDAETYPEASFKSNKVEQVDGMLIFYGVLDFRDVESPITINVNISGGGFNLYTQKYTLGFNAKTVFSRSAHRMLRYSGIVGDKVEIEVDGEFKRR